MDREKFLEYTNLILDEVNLALGCTEPIAIAFAAAKCKGVLGHFPEKIECKISGNVFKNAKSVGIPNSRGMRGIKPALLLGAIAGDDSLGLMVLDRVEPEDILKVEEMLAENICLVETVAEEGFMIAIFMTWGEESAKVVIRYSHLHISEIEKNGKMIFSDQSKRNKPSGEGKKIHLTLDEILAYIREPMPEEVISLLNQQIRINKEIAQEGLRGTYGLCIGKMLMEEGKDAIEIKMKASVAAASDARMDGCALPVVTNSGSGNQGLTVSVPILTYATHYKIEEKKVQEALCLSNMVAIWIKSGMAKLSAFCGAVSAACGVAAAICYLENGNKVQIEYAIINTLANTAGIICDGAKSSCALKIATSVDAALMGVKLAMRGLHLEPGEGLSDFNLQETIENYQALANEGMKETDRVVIEMMKKIIG